MLNDQQGSCQVLRRHQAPWWEEKYKIRRGQKTHRGRGPEIINNSCLNANCCIKTWWMKFEVKLKNSENLTTGSVCYSSWIHFSEFWFSNCSEYWSMKWVQISDVRHHWFALRSDTKYNSGWHRRYWSDTDTFYKNLFFFTVSFIVFHIIDS